MINETVGAAAVGSSAVLGRRFRITEENLRMCQRKQWERNKMRLIVSIGNLLTLGLGENLWYGDRLDRKVNTVPSSRLLRKDDINIENAVSASSLADQVSDARDEIKRQNPAKIWAFGRYKVTIERLSLGLHNNVVLRPNDPKLSHADERAASQAR